MLQPLDHLAQHAAQDTAKHTAQLARTELLPAAPPVLPSHPTCTAAIPILVLDIMSNVEIGEPEPLGLQ